MQRFQKQEGADRRVLIVEDNLEVRELLQRTCEREGWSAATAENGRAALSELAVQLPDVVLLDLMMPQMDGFQFLTEVRANAAWRAIPIVVVTAKTLTEAERSMLSLNADRVLQKAAYSPNDLVDEIRLALNNRVSSQKWIDLEC
jgi:CheY-like chemotaxis protein